MRSNFLAVTVFFIALFFVGHSFADNTTSDIFRAAVNNYQSGKYEEALDAFMRGYYKSELSINDATYEYYKSHPWRR